MYTHVCVYVEFCYVDSGTKSCQTLKEDPFLFLTTTTIIRILEVTRLLSTKKKKNLIGV